MYTERQNLMIQKQAAYLQSNNVLLEDESEAVKLVEEQACREKKT